MNQTSVKTRRKFDETFKREAVNNWLASRKSAEVIAQELGINSNRLYAWKQRFAPAAAGGGRRRGAQLVRWPICKFNWPPASARTATCVNSATY